MATTEELLKDISDFTRLVIYQHPPLLFHLLRRLSPLYVELYAGSLYKNLSAGETYEVEVTIAMGKVKLPQSVEYKYQTQAVIAYKVWRDGLLYYEDDNVCDTKQEAGSHYETWYPIFNGYKIKFTNNHTSSVWLHMFYTYILMDLDLYKKTMDSILKPLLRKVLGE